VLVPAGTLHALVNAGPTDVRFLNVHAPGGFDRRIGLGRRSAELGSRTSAGV
jgi:mannose-6-phosphate isomerase-like protein (cupin superfamily)